MYMSAHVLFNLLIELRKRDEMLVLPSILSLFRNQFNKFNKYKRTNVRFYLSYDIATTLESHFWCKSHYVCNVVMDVISYM